MKTIRFGIPPTHERLHDYLQITGLHKISLSFGHRHWAHSIAATMRYTEDEGFKVPEFQEIATSVKKAAEKAIRLESTGLVLDTYEYVAARAMMSYAMSMMGCDFSYPPIFCVPLIAEPLVQQLDYTHLDLVSMIFPGDWMKVEFDMTEEVRNWVSNTVLLCARRAATVVCGEEFQSIRMLSIAGSHQIRSSVTFAADLVNVAAGQWTYFRDLSQAYMLMKALVQGSSGGDARDDCMKAISLIRHSCEPAGLKRLDEFAHKDVASTVINDKNTAIDVVAKAVEHPYLQEYDPRFCAMKIATVTEAAKYGVMPKHDPEEIGH